MNAWSYVLLSVGYFRTAFFFIFFLNCSLLFSDVTSAKKSLGSKVVRVTSPSNLLHYEHSFNMTQVTDHSQFFSLCTCYLQMLNGTRMFTIHIRAMQIMPCSFSTRSYNCKVVFAVECPLKRSQLGNLYS